MNKKIIISLIAALIITVSVYLVIVNKNNKNKGKKEDIDPTIPDVKPEPKIKSPKGSTGGYVPDYSVVNNTPILDSGSTSITAPTATANFKIQNKQLVLNKLIQIYCGVKPDGVLGAKTKAAMVVKELGNKTMAEIEIVLITVTEGQKKYFPLQKGSKNAYVAAIQVMLGLKPDGSFGPATERALQGAGYNALGVTGFQDLYNMSTGSNLNLYGGSSTTQTIKKVAEVVTNPGGLVMAGIRYITGL